MLLNNILQQPAQQDSQFYALLAGIVVSVISSAGALYISIRKAHPEIELTRAEKERTVADAAKAIVDASGNLVEDLVGQISNLKTRLSDMETKMNEILRQNDEKDRIIRQQAARIQDQEIQIVRLQERVQLLESTRGPV